MGRKGNLSAVVSVGTFSEHRVGEVAELPDRPGDQPTSDNAAWSNGCNA